MQLVPADPPAFLRPLHAAFMRAGSQLRLLHSLEGHGRQLALQLGEVAEREAAARWHRLGNSGGCGTEAGPAGGVAGLAGRGAALLPGLIDGLNGQAGMAADDDEEASERWLGLGGGWGDACGTAGASDGSMDLQLSAAGLQEAVRISQEQDAARTAAVDAWLGGLTLQRRLAQQAAAEELLGRAVAQQQEATQRAERKAAALSRQQSGKAALLREQAAAVAERQLRRAAERAQEEAADRQLQARAALRQHSEAVAELEQALGHTGLSSSQLQPAAQPDHPLSASGTVRDQQQAAGPAQDQQDAQPAGLPSQPSAASLPPLKTRFQDERQQQQQQENTAPQGGGASGSAGAEAPRQPLQPGWIGLAPTQQQLPYAASAVLQHQLSVASGTAGVEDEGDEASVEALAPLSAVLETSLTHSVLSQYRAVSRACVRWAPVFVQY
jgi:hypothetical protein